MSLCAFQVYLEPLNASQSCLGPFGPSLDPVYTPIAHRNAPDSGDFHAMRRLALLFSALYSVERLYSLPLQLQCPSLAMLRGAMDLKRLEEPEVLAAFLPSQCGEWPLSPLPLFDVSARISQLEDLERWAEELPVGSELQHRAFSDAAKLVETFRKALKCRSEALRVRLKCLEHVQCSRLHFDEVPLRLVCALSGPGTLVLPESKANRGNLQALYRMPLEEQGAMSSEEWNRHLAKPSELLQAPSGSAVLLKGSLHPNATRGVLHCSPPAAKRLLLQLDLDG